MSDETGNWSGKGMLDIAQRWAATDGRTDARDLTQEQTLKFGDPMLTMAACVLREMSDATSHPTYLRCAQRMKDGRILTVAVDIKSEGDERQDEINQRLIAEAKSVREQRDELLAALKLAARFVGDEPYCGCELEAPEQYDDGVCGECEDWRIAANAAANAIAKAEGTP